MQEAGSISFLLIRELLIFIALKQSAYYASTPTTAKYKDDDKNLKMKEH